MPLVGVAGTDFTPNSIKGREESTTELEWEE